MERAPLLALPETGAVTAAEFADLMAPFAPFEPAPRLAVAVSGGGDSMALMLLAHDWARARGGRIFALTVDHGLRAESAAEAGAVAARCAALGIEHAILRWRGPHPKTGIQQAAREARYRLLEERCAEAGVLHLLLAHQREDQAETLLMRLMHGSGADGLAGMPALSERRALRLLRPLLGVPRRRLRATLAAAGQGWIEDPSNLNPVFLRTRLRAGMDELGRRGLGVDRLLPLAKRFGEERGHAERDTAALLARAAALDPLGFASLDPAPLAAAPRGIGMRALAAILVAVSGGDYPPRRERLARLYDVLCRGAAQGRSLNGCLVVPRRGRVLICREAAAMASPVALTPGTQVSWDGRFVVNLPPAFPPGLFVGGLGEAGPALDPPLRAALGAVPPPARPGLAAIRSGGRVLWVPGLGGAFRNWRQFGPVSVVFRPTRPLTGAGFTIV